LLCEFPIGSYVKKKAKFGCGSHLDRRAEPFELLPILTDYANKKTRGMKLKKKSSLKLQNQSQPNFAEMILGWSSSKTFSGLK
jgi:hypothetical protein